MSDTIEGLQLGNEYCFRVRPICGGQDTVGWGQPLDFYVDKTLWTDIVTSCPEGYVEDGNGNVTIFTAEGLAWLTKMGFDYREDTIYIMNDIDMSAYRWTPLGRYDFRGTLEGNNHIISNLYCTGNVMDEQSQNNSLVGYASNATFKNVIIKDGTFIGNHYVGGLFGQASNCSVINCQVINVNVKGLYVVGGLGGGLWSDGGVCQTYNCMSSGSVYGDQGVGGIYGSKNGAMKNCYSHCDVRPLGIRNERSYEGRGGLCGTARGDIYNCYSLGSVETHYNDYNNVVGASVGIYGFGEFKYSYSQYNYGLPFVGFLEDEYLVSDTVSFINNYLPSAVVIEENSYTDLLSALNAWVDTYDTAGIYRHWAADSANVNGGFPVFAAIPCTPATGSDSIVACDSYTWHGTLYTESTTLTDTLANLEGCDSIVTHHLVVNHGSTGTDTVSATNSYSWADSTLTASGIYQHTWPATNGCDSTVSLWLTITHTQYDTSIIEVHDTTYVVQHDTTYIHVYDTTYINVPVHDTSYIVVHDTAFVDVPYAVHDTTTVFVHDTTYITLTDTVTNTIFDTITNTVFDTVTNTIYDTTVVYNTDTLWLRDTMFVHDTIYIYDTVYVGVDDVETISAKIYTNCGQIVVEGAEDNAVTLFDVSGRMLATRRDEYQVLRFDVPVSGAYLIKIGSYPARRVVVVK